MSGVQQPFSSFVQGRCWSISLCLGIPESSIFALQ
jgi:hypothetical protein